MSSLLDSTAGTLVEALAARRIGALELCDEAIARIIRRDASINAVVVRDFERARDQAREADRRLAGGERAPLLGLPMTVKESFNVAGLATHWGIPPFKDFRPARDAVMVERLKAAGAVILGKTNVPTALADWQTVNPIHGLTVNPIDSARTPGGSSGGAAAALAARMVPLDLGSVLGGSIRVPAAFCGVFGHKPSLHLLPARGHDFPAHPGAPDMLAVVGPMARCVADLQRALQVLAGPDVEEAVAYRLALPPARRLEPRALRVLLLTGHPLAVTAVEVRSAVKALADDLANAGAVVTDGSALLPDLAGAHATYLSMLNTITTRGGPDAVSPTTGHQWLACVDRRALLIAQWRQLFEAFDVVLCPAFGTAPFEHVTERVMAKRVLRIDGLDTPYGAQLAWAGIASVAGLPATSVPIARTAAGLPIGAQIIGPHNEDATPLAVAAMIERLRADLPIGAAARPARGTAIEAPGSAAGPAAPAATPAALAATPEGGRR